MSDDDLRDYGMPSSGKPIGKPTWKPAPGEIDGVPNECPNCGAWLCEVQVEMENPLLVGGVGVAHYLGCPACPFASPAIVVAKGEDPSK